MKCFAVDNSRVMFLLHSVSLHNPPLSLPPLPLARNGKTPICTFSLGGEDKLKKARTFSSSSIQAVQNDPQEFEFDPVKARESLKKLDQQLSSLSQKPVTSPKKKVAAPDMNFTRDQMREDMPEISESFLAYSAFALVVFTIFYNILFYTVIQPSVDGPESIPATSVIREAPKAAVLQQLLTIPDSSIQP